MLNIIVEYIENHSNLFMVIFAGLNFSAIIVSIISTIFRDKFEKERYNSDIEKEAFEIYTQLTNVNGSDMNEAIIENIEEIEKGRYLSLYPDYQILQLTSSKVRNKIKELCEKCLKYKENNNDKLY